MAKTVEELFTDALQLPEAERAALAERLWASTSRDDYERAWAAEIERRVDDFRSGRVQGISADEVFRELRDAK